MCLRKLPNKRAPTALSYTKGAFWSFFSTLRDRNLEFTCVRGRKFLDYVLFVCSTKALPDWNTEKYCGHTASLSKVKAEMLNECSLSHTNSSQSVYCLQPVHRHSMFLSKMAKEPILVLLLGSGLKCPPSLPSDTPNTPLTPMELHFFPFACLHVSFFIGKET